MASVALEQTAEPNDGGHLVIHGIDLEIQQGEFVAPVGPSGYGK